ncbi:MULTISPECIES: hypothetical protein [Ralstonia solanacearum species complex]|uniref:hypothetical protein n=1 Tax=Ralstonia solanacearum species complex TaxID=3116862 RepID=UPI0013A636EC|nr:hypothetical protein [Ralstonia solanacearum]
MEYKKIISNNNPANKFNLPTTTRSLGKPSPTLPRNTRPITASNIKKENIDKNK